MHNWILMNKIRVSTRREAIRYVGGKQSLYTMNQRTNGPRTRTRTRMRVRTRTRRRRWKRRKRGTRTKKRSESSRRMRKTDLKNQTSPGKRKKGRMNT